MQQPRSIMVFRPMNLVFLGVLQVLTYYFLNFERQVRDLYDFELWFLVIGTICISAAGYLVNDYYDQPADEVNRPNKMPILNWGGRSIFVAYLLLNLLGLLAGFQLGNQVTLIFLLVIFLLWLYSFQLKRMFLIGNLVVSLLAGLSIYLVFYVFKTQSEVFVIFFSVFSFLFTFWREVAKDMEDAEGDRAAGYHTFPIVAGFRISKSILLSGTVFVSVLYASFQYKWVGHFFEGRMLLLFVAYQLLCLILPMLALTVKILKMKTTSDLHEISQLFKYIMATGMLSMAFF